MKANTLSFETELISTVQAYLGQPAIIHHEVVPGCARSVITPDRCMRVGLGEDGSFDCSGLVLRAMADIYRFPVGAQLRPFRHTRQQVAVLENAGEMGVPLSRATSQDIGRLVFTRLLAPNPEITVAEDIPWSPRVIHVSVLSGFLNDGRPVVLESAGKEHKVLERVPPVSELPIERCMYSAQALAEIIMNTTTLAA